MFITESHNNELIYAGEQAVEAKDDDALSLVLSTSLIVGKTLEQLSSQLDVAQQKYDCAWYENFAHKVSPIVLSIACALLLAMGITAIACIMLAPSCSFLLFSSLFLIGLFSIVSSSLGLVFIPLYFSYREKPQHKDKIDVHLKEIQEFVEKKESAENVLLMASRVQQNETNDRDLPPDVVRYMVAMALHNSEPVDK